MTDHTPTPWRAETSCWTPWNGAIGILPLNQDEESAIAWTTSGSNEAANAAFIVKAVNNHDLLVEALRQTLDRLEMIAQGRNADETRFFPQIDAAIECARVVLSRVGGAP